MTKLHLIFIIAGMLVLLVLVLKDPPEPQANPEPAQPLEGTLYSNRVKEIDMRENPLENLPQITVPESDIARLGLGSASQVLLKAVKGSSARCRLLPAESGRKKDKTRGGVDKSTGTIHSPGADSPPAPEFSFKFFNAILEESESTYLLNNRYSKGGITFEAEALCRWNDLYLLKFRITNDEEREFFSTRMEVKADGEPLRSALYAPFSCQPLRSIEGILTFPLKAMKGRKASLVMIEGGERGRSFPIESVDYAF